NRMIFGVIYSVVSSILDGTAKAAQFVVDSVRIPEIKSTAGSEPNKIYSAPVTKTERKESLDFLNNSVYENTESKKAENLNFFDPFENIPVVSESKPVVLTVSNNTMSSGYNSDIRIDEAYNRRQFEQQMIKFESCKFKGNLFNTYLIYEVGDTVYLIDQHAAHERLIYDRLCEKMSNRKIEGQGLIIPYLFDTNAQETEFIDSNIELIRKMGFDLKPFGIGSFRVDEVPTDLQDIDLSEFFKDLLSDLKELKDIKLEEMLKDKIAMTACKHAVRGGKQLTEDEVEALFKMMKGNMGLKCPHGRPVCVTLGKKDIEKMFKRIV
ncbi:MAG: hypothetical protein K2N33_01220, partial [Clostridia bacterium]|nr:hypothetical protein [Clostridia bacterium]